MSSVNKLLRTVLTIVKTLQDNPMGAVVLVCLSALIFAGYALTVLGRPIAF